MTGVSDDSAACPICGGPLETYFETKSGESDDNCRGRCGYSAHQEIVTNEATKLQYWVETRSFPMSKDGRKVARSEGEWKSKEFPSIKDSDVELFPQE